MASEEIDIHFDLTLIFISLALKEWIDKEHAFSWWEIKVFIDGQFASSCFASFSPNLPAQIKQKSGFPWRENGRVSGKKMAQPCNLYHSLLLMKRAT